MSSIEKHWLGWDSRRTSGLVAETMMISEAHLRGLLRETLTENKRLLAKVTKAKGKERINGTTRKL